MKNFLFHISLLVLLLLTTPLCFADETQQQHKKRENDMIQALRLKRQFLESTTAAVYVAYPQYIVSQFTQQSDRHHHHHRHRHHRLESQSSAVFNQQRRYYNKLYQSIDNNINYWNNNIEETKMNNNNNYNNNNNLNYNYFGSKKQLNAIRSQELHSEFIAFSEALSGITDHHQVNHRRSLTLFSTIFRSLLHRASSSAPQFFAYPEQVDDVDGWTNYAILVLVMGLIPVVIGALLTCFMFWFCICHTFCCKNKYKMTTGYRGKDRRPLWITYVVGLVLIWIFICISIGFNVSFNSSARGVTTEIFNTTTEIKEVAGTVKGSMENILNKAYGSLDRVGDLTDRLSTLSGLFDEVLDVIDETDTDLNALKTVLERLDGWHRDAIGPNQQLLEAQEEGRISGVPNLLEEPLSFVVQLEASKMALRELVSMNESIHDYQRQTETFTQEIQSSASDFTDTMRNQANDTIGTANRFVDDFVQLVSDAEPALEEVKNGVDIAEIVRLVLFLVLAVMIGVVYTAGLGCIWFRKHKLIHGTSCCSYLFVFWLMFFFGLSMLLFQVSNDLCTQHMDLIDAAAADMGTPEVGNYTRNVLKCSGDTTLLDVFEFNTDEFNITGVLDESLNEFENDIKEYNALEPINDALHNIEQMDIALQNISFDGYEPGYQEFRTKNRDISTTDPDLQQHIDRIDTLTQQILNDLPDAIRLNNDVKSRPNEAKDVVQRMKDRVNSVYDGTDDTIASFRDVLSDATGLLDFTQCAWIGNKYDSIESDACGGMVVATNFIGWMAGLTAVVMCVLFPVVLIWSYRMRNDFFEKRESSRGVSVNDMDGMELGAANENFGNDNDDDSY